MFQRNHVRILCIGELLVDFCGEATDVELCAVESFTREAGGAPANVAVGAVRLGCCSSFVGAVGTDCFGIFLEDALVKNGVDTSKLIRTGDARTTLAFIAHHTDGHKDIEFYRNPGADMYLSAAHIDEGYVKTFDVVHFGSISLIDEVPRAATVRARDVAISNRALTTYDVNWRPRLWGDLAAARQVIWAGAEGVSVAKLSQEEWEAVLATKELQSGAERLLDRGVGLVVRTEGSAGASFVTRRGTVHVPAFQVQAIDCLGAGDAFMAGLICELGGYHRAGMDPAALTDSQLVRAITYAQAVAAVTVRRKGAMPALPAATEVEEFVAQIGCSVSRGPD